MYISTFTVFSKWYKALISQIAGHIHASTEKSRKGSDSLCIKKGMDLCA